MAVVVFSILARLAGALIITTFLGGLFWLVGAAIVISYLGSLRVAADWNAVITFGVAAGVAACLFWREDTEWGSWARLLPVLVAWALLITWLGLIILRDALAPPEVRGLPGIPAPTAAWVGAMIGASIPHVVIAAYRARRRGTRP